MSSSQRASYLLLVTAFSLAIIGCNTGQKHVVVTGKLVENGQPLAFDGPDYQEGASGVEVTFYPVDESGQVSQGAAAQSFGTRVQPDGTFKVDGMDGKGIPAGRYRVTLQHRKAGYNARTQGDAFKGKFAFDKTPFTVDVQEEGQEIVLDIGSAGSGVQAGAQ